MSLRKKTLLTIGIITLTFSGLLLLVVRGVLLTNYNRLQEKNTRRNTEMVRESFLSEMDQLNSTVEDWGYWDDTYRFAQGQNPDYIELNLIDSVFENMGWRFFAILSSTGELLYLQEYDLKNSTTISPPDVELQNWLEMEPVLRPQSKISSSHSGIVALSDQAMLVAAAPILTSLELGPEVGKLVLGRELTLPNPSHTQTISWEKFNGSELSADPQTSLAAQSGEIILRTPNKERIAGYFSLPGLNNDPVLLVSVEEDREIYLEGVQTITLFLILFFILSLLFGGVLLYALEKNILSRLDIIRSGIRDVGERRDLSHRIHLSGGDELAELAERINETLAALQTSKSALTQNEARFEYESFHDALTDLPNRDYFMQELDRAAQKSQVDPNYSAAVLLINLDRFKLINDGFNHDMGDQVLIGIRDRIQGSLRVEDCLARLGGDEFVILLENASHPDSATEIASRIQRRLMAPFQIHNHHFLLTASIGIAFTSPVLTARDVLRNADIATNHAKISGRAQYALYEPSMHSNSLNLLQVESELLLAVERDELTLHYQPVISLKNGRITAVEALIRWLHPEMGLIYPGEFIPVAEKSGLILSISKWVLQTACRQLKEWQAFSPFKMQIAINLSARELQDQNFLNLIEQQLSGSGITSQLLQIEITESTGMSNIDLATHTLTRLKDLGVHIAIDDFGTGYSSLAYLSRFPASSIKIDGSFIRDIENNPENQAIVSAMIAMAHALGMEVVAEGVETYKQMEFLRSRDCDLAQGFFFCRPLPANIFSSYLHEQQRLLRENYQQP